MPTIRLRADIILNPLKESLGLKNFRTKRWEYEDFCVNDHFSSLVLMRVKSLIEDFYASSGQDWKQHQPWEELGLSGFGTSLCNLRLAPALSYVEWYL